MNDLEPKLIAEVLAHPDDDAPRLVHADWLEEHGDPRAALIRVQCELAATDPVEPGYGDLLLREEELLEQHQATWLRNLQKFQDFAYGVERPERFCRKSGEWRETFHRGYIGYGTFSHPFAANAVYQSVLQYAPVQRVAFRTSLKGWLDKANEMKALHGVKGLLLAETGQQAADDSSWLKDPPWTNLEELSFNPRDPAALQQMAGSPAYQNLKRLRCRWLNPHPEAVQALSESGVVASLNQLNWNGPSLTGMISALFSSQEARLRILTASGVLTDSDNSDFFNAPGLRNLTELRISHENPGDFLHDLFQPGICPHLRLLGLGNLESPTLNITEFPPGAASLRQLDFSNCKIGAKTLKAISQSAHLTNLTHLDVRNISLSDRQAATMIEAGNFANLRKLVVQTRKLKPPALKAMKKRFGKAKLNTLGVAFFSR